MGQLEQFLSDIAPNGDWQPLIDYINQNYVSKEEIKLKIKDIKATKENYNFYLNSEDIRRTSINLLNELLGEEYE